jgi:hypothetical protein
MKNKRRAEKCYFFAFLYGGKFFQRKLRELQLATKKRVAFESSGAPSR